MCCNQDTLFMYVLPEALERYISDHSSPESPILADLNRDTQANVLLPRMLSGHTQGVVLQLLSSMIRPKRILEIGTYTGYSAICLADGLAADGELITIDRNDELEEKVRSYFQQAGLDNKITYLLGDAREEIPKLTGPFDLIFIDADKKNYALYYDLLIDKLEVGGYLLADNVLWSGKVVDPTKNDTDTEALRAFNRKLAQDKRLLVTILSVRDGITLAKRIA